MVLGAGEWTAFWILVGLFAIGAIWLIGLLIRKIVRPHKPLKPWNREPIQKVTSVAIGLVLVGSIFGAIIISDGVHNQQASNDLHAAGFTVVSVDVNNNRATVTDRDSQRQNVLVYQSGDTYVATTLCPVSPDGRVPSSIGCFLPK